jgi:hypothetical protein
MIFAKIGINGKDDAAFNRSGKYKTDGLKDHKSQIQTGGQCKLLLWLSLQIDFYKTCCVTARAAKKAKFETKLNVSSGVATVMQVFTRKRKILQSGKRVSRFRKSSNCFPAVSIPPSSRDVPLFFFMLIVLRLSESILVLILLIL